MNLHVYDWLDQPASNPAEADAKEWLNNFVKPSYVKYNEGIDKWLDRFKLTVMYQGTRYICSGASRMGDVWLKREGSQNFYDLRVEVEELTDWRRVALPTT